jgi:catechol 2,3-dioxygenase-like lactoylglutathione lyase family enzyme
MLSAVPVQVRGISAFRLFAYPDFWEKTRDFYQATLGLPLEFSNPDGGVALFRLGGVALLVERIDREEPESAELVGHIVAINFEVADAGHAARVLESEGVPITGGPEKQGWGGTLLFVEDPSGNGITLVELPRG